MKQRHLLFDRDDIMLYWFPVDGFELSVLVGKERRAKRYVGYTVDEAKDLFMDEFNR